MLADQGIPEERAARIRMRRSPSPLDAGSMVAADPRTGPTSPLGAPAAGRVIVAGGGIASLEAVLALRALAGDRAKVTLLAPGERFTFDPAATTSPFHVGSRAPQPALAELVASGGAELRRGLLAAVEPRRHVALTAAGEEIPYDRLVVAVGALRLPALDRPAVTFSGPSDVLRYRRLLDDLVRRARRGLRTRLVLVVPPGPGWPLPVYELGLLTVDHLRRRGLGRTLEVSVATAEEAPLGIFGSDVSAAVAGDLERAGVRVHAGVVVQRWRPGERLELSSGAALSADQVVALPLLRGPALAGLPCDDDGFIPADEDGRVRDVDDVFVAGDAGPFAIKQGGLACQQADATACALARELGARPKPMPFRPVLRALLLEGREQRFMRRELVPGARPVPALSWTLELRWPAGKVTGHFLTPFLERHLPASRQLFPPGAGG
jgi:sulfide:quinone oxidoreductase